MWLNGPLQGAPPPPLELLLDELELDDEEDDEPPPPPWHVLLKDSPGAQLLEGIHSVFASPTQFAAQDQPLQLSHAAFETNTPLKTPS